MLKTLLHLVEKLSGRSGDIVLNDGSANVVSEEFTESILKPNFHGDLSWNIGNLASQDVACVLDALSQRNGLPFFELVASPNIKGVSLRIDLSRGLTKAAFDLLLMTCSRGLVPWVLLPLVAANDMGFACEGRFFFNRNVFDRLMSLITRCKVLFGFLADPSHIITRVLESPFAIWQSAHETLRKQGVQIHGYGCSFHQTVGALLEMLWAYRAAGLLKESDLVDLTRQIGFACREWVYETNPDGFFPKPADGLVSVALDAWTEEKPIFLRSMSTELNLGLKLRRMPSLDYIAYTDWDGWHLLTVAEGDQRIDSSGLGTLIASVPRDCSFGVVIDPADLYSATLASPEHVKPGVLRELPFPFHHYLAINSDIDWSTHSQVDKMIDQVCGNYGLPLAISTYLFSRDDRWPAWSQVTDSKSQENRQRGRQLCWAGQGLIDTCHGITHSFDAIALEGQWVHNDRRFCLELVSPRTVDGYDGIRIVPAPTGTQPEVAIEMDDGSVCLIERVADADDDDNPEGGLLYFFDALSIAGKKIRRLIIGNTTDSVVGASVNLIYASMPKAKALLQTIENLRFTLPVFTTHGGGYPPLHATIATAEYNADNPAVAIDALDRPGNAHHLLPTLKQRGVFFFNPVGFFSDANLYPVDALIREHIAQDNSRIYIFCRYFSALDQKIGNEAPLSYGKHPATLQGFAATLSSLLQDMSWRKPGSGCIVYTHLGHKLGNQVSADLGWNDEVLSAWSNLAEFVAGSDVVDPVPFRLWYAPTAMILAFAAVSRGLARSLTIENNTVSVTSWYDECLGHRIPNPQSFGTSWLHGVTIYVDDPEKTTVLVDGQELEHFTCNPADALGGKSISLVDVSWKRALVPDPASVRMHGSLAELACVVIPEPGAPVVVELPMVSTSGTCELDGLRWPLVNVSHWTFEVRQDGSCFDWLLGFNTSADQWFDAGTAREADWTVRLSRDGNWRRFTFAFHDAFGRGLPRGRIVGLRVRVSALASGGNLSFRDIAMIRPCSTRRAVRDQKILAGKVTYGLDSAPMVGTEVLCRLPDNTLSTTTDAGGFYMFQGLPKNARCAVRLSSLDPDRYACMRGPVAYLTCDQWDWDLHCYAAPDLELKMRVADDC